MSRIFSEIYRKKKKSFLQICKNMLSLPPSGEMEHNHRNQLQFLYCSYMNSPNTASILWGIFF